MRPAVLVVIPLMLCAALIVALPDACRAQAGEHAGKADINQQIELIRQELDQRLPMLRQELEQIVQRLSRREDRQGYAESNLSQRIDSLAAKVDNLEVRLDGLSQKIDALSMRYSR